MGVALWSELIIRRRCSFRGSGRVDAFVFFARWKHGRKHQYLLKSPLAVRARSRAHESGPIGRAGSAAGQQNLFKAVRTKVTDSIAAFAKKHPSTVTPAAPH